MTHVLAVQGMGCHSIRWLGSEDTYPVPRLSPERLSLTDCQPRRPIFVVLLWYWRGSNGTSPFFLCVCSIIQAECRLHCYSNFIFTDPVGVWEKELQLLATRDWQVEWKSVKIYKLIWSITTVDAVTGTKRADLSETMELLVDEHLYLG